MARNPDSGRPNPALVLGKLLGALLVTAALVVGVLLPFVGGLGLAANHEALKFLDKTCTLQETAPPQKSELFARDGKTLIATIFKQDRQPVPLSTVQPGLVKALIATEDRRFYQHHGVDMRGLIRSAISTSSGDTQGGSTLTMQYVKQVRYYQAGDNPKKQRAAIAQNLNRKIEDAKCAIQIEKRESKETILDNYLNIAFFGEHAYGVEVAAETYFHKRADQLTLPESAMLVGLLRAPTAYDPFVYPDAARHRRNEVLQNLVDVGYITQRRADQYAAQPVSLATDKPPLVQEGCINAPNTIANVGFFCDYAVNWLEKNKAVSQSQLQSGGLKIVTTLDPNLQNRLQRRVHKSLRASAPMTAVLPVVDPKTGDVLAMAASKFHGNRTSKTDNRHTLLPIFTKQAAQGASTYKLFPLLTALSTGFPSGYELETPPDSTGYRPLNCLTDNAVHNGDANETYNSNETLASATAKSSNTYFVGLADQGMGCDLQPIIDLAEKLGMSGLNRPSGEKHLDIAQQILKYESATRLVLGDIPTSPLELTGAYAAVANDGRYNAPAPILSITDRQGHTLAVPRSPAVQVVAPQVALQAVKLLEGDTTPPGTSADSFASWYSNGGDVVAGKTGTAPGCRVTRHHNYRCDKNGALWFVGMTPNLVATTALVDFDHTSNPASHLPGVRDAADNAYGAYAARVWLHALAPTLQKRSWAWQDPDYVKGDHVPNVSGMTLSDARRTLKDAGYKMVQFDGANQATCENQQGVPLGSVAFYGPQIAPPGATITVCPSAGIAQQVYVPPPPPPTTYVNPSPNPGSSSSSEQSSSTPPPPPTSSTGAGSSPPPPTGGPTGGGPPSGHGHGPRGGPTHGPPHT